MLLSRLIPSLTVWNVWDLPVWAWVQYRDYCDNYVKEAKKRA